MMMFGYGGGGWPVWAVVLMWVGMLVVLGLLLWAGYAIVTGSSIRRDSESREDAGRARRVLDERLASGEIDAADYQELIHLIATGDDPAPAGTRGKR